MSCGAYSSIQRTPIQGVSIAVRLRFYRAIWYSYSSSKGPCVPPVCCVSKWHTALLLIIANIPILGMTAPQSRVLSTTHMRTSNPHRRPGPHVHNTPNSRNWRVAFILLHRENNRTSMAQIDTNANASHLRRLLESLETMTLMIRTERILKTQMSW